MIFAILLLSALFTIGECCTWQHGRCSDSGRKTIENFFWAPKSQSACEAECTKYATKWKEQGCCMWGWDRSPDNGNSCYFSTNSVRLYDKNSHKDRSNNVCTMDKSGEEDAVGKKLFPGPICVKGGTAGGVTCSGPSCHKCAYGWNRGTGYNTCCSADEARVGTKFCRCSATICKANGVDSGHCDMGKNGKTGGCDRCKRGYRTTLLGTDWCCTADDANRYADCKCTTSHTCVAGGVDSGHCDKGKNGRTGGCDKCKRGYRRSFFRDWCCTSTDVNKYTDCTCSPKSEAEVAIAVSEPHDTVPVIVYGLSFMGLGVVLYGAGKYYCGKKDDMELL